MSGLDGSGINWATGFVVTWADVQYVLITLNDFADRKWEVQKNSFHQIHSK